MLWWGKTLARGKLSFRRLPVSLVGLIFRQKFRDVDGIFALDSLIPETDLGQEVGHLRKLFVRFVGNLKNRWRLDFCRDKKFLNVFAPNKNGAVKKVLMGKFQTIKVLSLIKIKL